MSDVEREYSPSSRAGGSAQPHVDRYRRESTAAADAFGAAWQRTPGGSLLLPVDGARQLLVFVHGGYWQLMGVADSMFLAPRARHHGWSYAAVEYTIAPAGTVARMVDEVAAELEAVVALSPAATEIVLVGHSAGAHLAAMVAIVRAATVPIRRVVLVSGVYDLRPLLQTTVNEPLGLDAASAAELSPQLLGVAGRPEVVVAWGDDDTDAFRAQSRAYAEHLRDAGLEVTSMECAARHHFDVIDDVVRIETALGAAALAPLSRE